MRRTLSIILMTALSSSITIFLSLIPYFFIMFPADDSFAALATTFDWAKEAIRRILIVGGICGLIAEIVAFPINWSCPLRLSQWNSSEERVIWQV